MGEKRIIVNGDDFGYSDGVNRGIIEAYETGILTSTTILANSSFESKPLADLARPRLAKPALGIGVHLNVTSGEPLSSEWPQARFSRPCKGTDRPEEWMGSTWAKFIAQFSPEQFRAEYTAQIKRAIAVFGSIDHLDSHISNASYLPASEIYLELARRYSLGARPLAPLSEKPEYGGNMIIDPGFYAQARAWGIRTVDSADLRYADKEIFYKALEKVRPGEITEFMFHPATDDSHGGWRMRDLKLITSYETTQKIRDLNIKLATYRDIALDTGNRLGETHTQEDA